MADQNPAESGARSSVLLRSTASADDTVAWQADPTLGAGLVTQATRIAGEDIPNDVLKTEQRFLYNYITTATTTVVKASAGFLHRIIVGGGTTGTISIYDHASSATNPIMAFDTTNAIQSLEFNVSTASGIVVVTSAATKVTVAYK